MPSLLSAGVFGTRLRLQILLFAALGLFAPDVRAQVNPGPGDFGDAPEGPIAYPTNPPVLGRFPTCWAGGPVGFIWHPVAQLPGNRTLFFRSPFQPGGVLVDEEVDGNAGKCGLAFSEMDECSGWNDNGDAGLIFPEPYTFSIYQPTPYVAPCRGYVGMIRSLGSTCQYANWGRDIDIFLVNRSGIPAVVNVLMDWNQDGEWYGTPVGCGGPVTDTPEHVVVNLLVPPNFSGLLSQLNAAPFKIGPNPGLMWVRFSIMPPVPPVPPGWTGDGIFDDGETEDYLIRVDPFVPLADAGDQGDAPDGYAAYPSGLIGHFPTCDLSYSPAPAGAGESGGGPSGSALVTSGFVRHAPGGQMWLGNSVDMEYGGNNGLCPAGPSNQDECGTLDGDAGLRGPSALILRPDLTLAACDTSAVPLGITCGVAAWGVDLDVQVTNNAGQEAYLNVLADWDRNGVWDGSDRTCAGGTTGSEHALRNFPIPPGFNGLVSSLAPPALSVPAEQGPVWFRVTVSEAAVADGWDGRGVFADGETEDYLLMLASTPVDVALDTAMPRGLALALGSANPAHGPVALVLEQPRYGMLEVVVRDLAGRTLSTLHRGAQSPGRYVFHWDGRREDGRRAGPGVYFVSAQLDGEVTSVKVTRLP